MCIRDRSRLFVFSAVQIIGYLSVATGILLAQFGQRASAPAIPFLNILAVRLLSLALVIVGSIMLIWTVFLEIPLGLKRRGIPSGKVYRYGCYAVCRHPGFWWLLLLTLGLSVLNASANAWNVFFLTNICNLLLISLQDRYTFPVQFADYHDYAREVPFLIPKRIR
ncbi:MAG: hypothetical protein N3A02_06210, partial [Rectinema sp.]|nr:hypothetical protein [Rectinema sp.]